MSRSERRKVIFVCGARPNFMKVGPIWREMGRYPRTFQRIMVHTGQHYDDNMSRLFFRDLELPEPHVYFGVGSASPAVQTARIMIKFEKMLLKEKPDLIIVVGDVNSTLACALVASKLQVPIAHVEAGLRSFDRTMPEEINRIVSDNLSDLLFTSCRDGNKNLKKEGISSEKVFFVGNVMIDTLARLKGRADTSGVLRDLGLEKGRYAVLTLHRPSNVDDRETMQRIFEALENLSGHIPVIFPVHPRTLESMRKFRLNSRSENLRLTEPLGYLDFLKLYMNARFVMTDSGGIQEETTYLGIPCLTLRENTERPITIREGTNILVGTDKEKIITEGLRILKRKGKSGAIPELWDGKAAGRIVKVLREAI